MTLAITISSLISLMVLVGWLSYCCGWDNGRIELSFNDRYCYVKREHWDNLQKLANHLDWDPEDGSSIARRIADRWDELEQRAYPETVSPDYTVYFDWTDHAET